MSTFLMRILLISALFSNIIYAQNIALQYNLKIGDSIKVFQKAEQDIVQDFNGTKHELKNVLEGEFTFVISNKTDSIYTINFKFDRFKLLTSSNLSGEVINIDTNNDFEEGDIQGKIFSGMIGTKLTMEMYKTGKIKSVSGTEKMIADMVNNAGVTDEFTKQLMIESMKKEFGNKSLARSFEQMTYIYPLKKVAVGDTWTNSYSGKINAKNTWKLEALKDKTIQLTGEGDVKMYSVDDTLTMTLNGTQQTNITAIKLSGFAKEMSVTLTADGFSVMEQMKDTEIPTKITSITTYKTIKYVQ
ncbi:hypothetical protein KO566_06530 [Flavobacteriaceae bacterium XHP0103]|uniref:DUF6263 family protein n=1 Tax=Marixanthotalea marina TaxID=2844359 RepID=UPI002989FD0D|nr:DUF6263 family protein [Marixanthotalea marina]MBU3821710.1 hypothetical protein [Marixanthotalea marina]